MRRVAMAVAAAGVFAGTLAGAQTAGAAATNTNTTPAPVAPQTTSVPAAIPLGCLGETGLMGCGPGWIWRDGWKGWACYVC